MHRTGKLPNDDADLHTVSHYRHRDFGLRYNASLLYMADEHARCIKQQLLQTFDDSRVVLGLVVFASRSFLSLLLAQRPTLLFNVSEHIKTAFLPQSREAVRHHALQFK
jgi:hypothetical protein